MRTLKGRTAIVTGASRGIGCFIAHTLAAHQMRLVLAARVAADLEAVAAELRHKGAEVVVAPTDLRDPGARQELITTAERTFGTVDVLVNNAAMLTVAAYHHLPTDQLEATISLNLAAPMHLTQLVLPGMLAQHRGHIVNITSLAGKGGIAYLEPYVATKAGLLGFTAALRASYRGSGMSASAICPGYVGEVGMYQRVHAETGVELPAGVSTVAPQQVARAVPRAIVRDLPEVYVNPVPVRPLFAVQAFLPRLVERLLPRLGTDYYRQAGQVYERRQSSGS